MYNVAETMLLPIFEAFINNYFGHVKGQYPNCCTQDGRSSCSSTMMSSPLSELG